MDHEFLDPQDFFIVTVGVIPWLILSNCKSLQDFFRIPPPNSSVFLVKISVLK